MTGPGLALFYGGLVRKKNVLGTMMQSFIMMAVITVIWAIFGYSLAFAKGSPFIGSFEYLLLNGVGAAPSGYAATIPHQTFMVFQLMFAIITPALITGAFANRVSFKAYFLFLTGWLIFVYFPFVHMVWSPNGIFAKWGVLDFAGGIVVHNTAGFAALASVLYVGRRQEMTHKPHNVPLIALGTGLLWFGWYGFNAGSELRVDAVTASAFLNTDVAASFAAVSWLLMEWLNVQRPKFLGLLTGSVAGLATITPAAGYVSLGMAAIIGIVAAAVCYGAVALKNKLELDDALDVWGVHGVGGLTGTILLGAFASKAWNPAGADGLLLGGGTFFVKECIAVFASGAWAFIFTGVMLWLIDHVTPVKVDALAERHGLDTELHGEQAYLSR
jgi:ammonium transporter, Amt family